MVSKNFMILVFLVSDIDIVSLDLAYVLYILALILFYLEGGGCTGSSKRSFMINMMMVMI